jgi:hypothetical protein
MNLIEQIHAEQIEAGENAVIKRLEQEKNPFNDTTEVILPKNTNIEVATIYVCSDGTETRDPVEAEIIQAELDFKNWYSDSANFLYAMPTASGENHFGAVVNYRNLIEWLREHEKQISDLLGT